MNEGFGFINRPKEPLTVRYGCHAVPRVFQQGAWNGNQKAQEVLQDARRLIVGHNPNAHSRQNRCRGRLYDNAAGLGVVRHILVSDRDYLTAD